MSAPAKTTRALHGWPTRRFELMRTPLCELPVSLEDGPYARVIRRVENNLARRGLDWMPPVYLSTGWHCPDKIPVIGVPFSLATTELRRIEREVTEGLETPDEMVRLLRHEVGHAYNYALKLYATQEWRELFGPMSKPYREHFEPNRRSRQFVRHLHGHYAQKHPDEDFAETFAVWLTPRSRWRRDYARWGALRKLEYVDRVMAAARDWHPRPVSGPKVEPLEELRHTVARHYQRLGYPMNEYGFESQACAYLDEDLRAALSGPRAGGAVPADAMLRRLKRRITARVIELLNVRAPVAEKLYDKYVERAEELGLTTGRAGESLILVSVSTIMTTHLVSRRQTGRFTRPKRVVRRR